MLVIGWSDNTGFGFKTVTGFPLLMMSRYFFLKGLGHAILGNFVNHEL